MNPNPAMRIDPASPTAGEMVEVRFPDEPLRGLRYVLERQTDDGWVPMYTLVSDGAGEATWWPVADDDKRPIGAMGIEGPGPDRVVIPGEADSGTYRLCTDVVEESDALEESTVCTPVPVE